jgi:hypothetical protein
MLSHCRIGGQDRNGAADAAAAVQQQQQPSEKDLLSDCMAQAQAAPALMSAAQRLALRRGHRRRNSDPNLQGNIFSPELSGRPENGSSSAIHPQNIPNSQGREAPEPLEQEEAAVDAPLMSAAQRLAQRRALRRNTSDPNLVQNSDFFGMADQQGHHHHQQQQIFSPQQLLQQQQEHFLQQQRLLEQQYQLRLQQHLQQQQQQNFNQMNLNQSTPVQVIRPIPVRLSISPLSNKPNPTAAAPTRNGPLPAEPQGIIRAPAPSPAPQHLHLTTINSITAATKKEAQKQRLAQKLQRHHQTSHRSSRKQASWYHKVAASYKLGSIQETFQEAAGTEEDEDEEEEEEAVDDKDELASTEHSTGSYKSSKRKRQKAKQEILNELNRTVGESKTPAFQAALNKLIQYYDPTHFDPRQVRHPQAFPYFGYEPDFALDPDHELEGIGISAGKPTFPGCIGRNQQGDPTYRLGTMSFDMFCPTQLVVSIQGTFVLIDIVDGSNEEQVKNVPKHLLADVREGKNPVRSYNVVTAITIEAWQPEFGENSPNKSVDQPIRGVMTTYGFILPYPSQNHRFSVWFTGGSLQVDDVKNSKWFHIFDKDNAPRRTVIESSKVLTAKLLMGATTNDEMDKDGKLSYSLKRPASTYIDLLYLDRGLQVFRASSGTVYVHVRLPGREAVHKSEESDDCLPISLDPLLRESCCNDSAMSQQAVPVQVRSQPPPPPALPPQQPEPVVPIPKKSCLKKSSSYGDLEELNEENIPINRDRKAWMALPAPKPPEKVQKQPLLRRAQLRRAISDPSLLWSGQASLEKDVDDTDDSTDSTESDGSSSSEQEQTGGGTNKAAEVPPSEEEEEPKPIHRTVSFSCLEIRSYDLTIGDNPSCQVGPPISLDWTYQQQVQMPLQRYEFMKYGRKGPSSPQKQRTGRLSAAERSLRLRHEFGFGMNEIRAATSDAERIRVQRKFTNKYRTNRAMMKVEGAIESARRNVRRLVKRRHSDQGCAA